MRSRLTFVCSLSLLALGLAGTRLAAQDSKALADALIREVRTHQQADGSYGELATTCRVLDLLGRSPRRYNELDGPFIRRAAELVAADGDAALDPGRILALAGAVTPDLTRARSAAVRRVAGDPAQRDTYLGVLALTVAPPAIRPTFPAIEGPPELAVLLAENPTSVAPPSVDQPQAWARWARSARLRGLRPAVWPDPPPPPQPGTPLVELLDRLEVVIAFHGLADAPSADAGSAPPPPRVETPRAPDAALHQALAWLDAAQDDGTFGLSAPGWDGPEPGITALCLSATLRSHELLGTDPPAWVATGLDWLAALQREDGSIQTYGVAVYTTSVAMEALLDGGHERHAEVVARALEFLLAAQADEGEGYSSTADPHYGGVGYGGDERPDLSNTQIAAGAAERAGLPNDHPFFQRMIAYLERHQNRGEEAPWSLPRKGGGEVVAGTDGGATYMPGSSPAGEDEIADGVFVARSYGSMTYALTRSYLICGLPADDPRVSAASRWLVENFTLETNPGFTKRSQGGDGLYYYYLAMSRTMGRLPADQLVRSDGSRLDWRRELSAHLRTEQRTDGSWVNPASSRWYEGAPSLCSAFAILALVEALEPQPGG